MLLNGALVLVAKALGYKIDQGKSISMSLKVSEEETRLISARCKSELKQQHKVVGCETFFLCDSTISY